MNFAKELLQWYARNKRSLPWRATRDPYRIWLSEVILQQTRMAQGIPYYLKFTERFPTVFDLAKATEEAVLKLWQGLGYYSRARNLHATAQRVAFDRKGRFPDNYKDLLKLKGVGDYTASAIASICFDEPRPVVDGNVYRVLSRFFGVDLPINDTAGIKYFKQLATEVMDTQHIRDYNQAIMEFGSLQCVPASPDCTSCPLHKGCVAYATNRVGTLPVKPNRTKIRNRFFNYLVLLDDRGNTMLHQRTGKGIWRNLWQFPLLETHEEVGHGTVKENISKVSPGVEAASITLFNDHKIVHKLSHQHLHTRFWIVRVREPFEGGIPVADLESYPVPVLIADFIKPFKNSYFYAENQEN